MRRLWQKINTTKCCSRLISFIKALHWVVWSALTFMSVHTLMGYPVNSRIFAATFLISVGLELLESGVSIWYYRLLNQEYRRHQTWHYLGGSFDQ